MEQYGGKLFEVSPSSFVQVNHGITEKVIETLSGQLQASGTGKPVLIDLYSGIGTLSLPLAGNVKEVLAVEINEAACSSADRNAAKNGITNYHVYRGEAGSVLPGLLKRITPEKRVKSVLLADPPRSGFDPDIVRTILRGSFDRIVYLSCNPHTQARDVAMLTGSGQYRATSVTPFDMFPQTFHVESLVVLDAM
jgi:23S rRNA (uracil1939-C5)-methyltransferase